MINLLPPELKEEIRYSKRNATLRRYLLLVILVSVVLAGILLGARYLLNHQITATDQAIAAKQEQIAGYSELEKKAAGINSRLKSIQTIQKSQSKFSMLLSDLAEYMPVGTAIDSIALTGDDKKPVRLTVTATDYKTAAGFRDSLTRSKRISAADIESIERDTKNPNLYRVTVTFTFSPGQAR